MASSGRREGVSAPTMLWAEYSWPLPDPPEVTGRGRVARQNPSSAVACDRGGGGVARRWQPAAPPLLHGASAGAPGRPRPTSAVRRPRMGQAIKTYSTAQKNLAHTGPVVGPPSDGPRGWRTCAGADASADATPAAREESGRAWANRRAVVPGRHGVFSRQLSTVRRLSAGEAATRAAAPPATCRHHRRKSLAPAPRRAPRPPALVSTPSTTRAQPSGQENLVGGAGVPQGCGAVVGWRLPNLPPNEMSVGPALARARRNTVVGARFHRLETPRRPSLCSQCAFLYSTRKEHPCARGSVTCALVAGSLRGGNTVFASTGVLSQLGQLPLLTAVKHAQPSRTVEAAGSRRPRLDSWHPTGRRTRADGRRGSRTPVAGAPPTCGHLHCVRTLLAPCCDCS